MYRSGSFRAGNDFSEPNTRDITKDWQHGTIQKFIEKPERFIEVIEHAAQFVDDDKSEVDVPDPVEVSEESAATACFDESSDEECIEVL